MHQIDRIIQAAYDDGITASECVKLLDAAGFPGFTWENVADMYEEIYVVEEGK